VPGHTQAYAVRRHTDITRGAVPRPGPAPPPCERPGRVLATGAAGRRHV